MVGNGSPPLCKNCETTQYEVRDPYAGAANERANRSCPASGDHYQRVSPHGSCSLFDGSIDERGGGVAGALNDRCAGRATEKAPAPHAPALCPAANP